MMDHDSYKDDSECLTEDQEDQDVNYPVVQKGLVEKLQQVEVENLSHVLKKLDSIRQLAVDAQVLRHRENRELTSRQVAIGQLYSLLLEDAGFQPQAVMQRSVLAMFEGIKLQHAEVFFFSHEDVRKRLLTGPGVRLKDAENNPRRIAERLPVTSEVVDRMLADLTTDQIRDLVGKVSKYLTFKQTTYQVKTLEEKDDALVKNATGFAVYKSIIIVADALSHCMWCISPDTFTDRGNHKVELFAGKVGEPGSMDGAMLDARFRSPMGIVICEERSTAFVADTDNNAIRRIDLEAGFVSTIQFEYSPITRDWLGAELVRPKGICVLRGEEAMFASLERTLEKHREDAEEAFSEDSQETSEESTSRSSFTSTVPSSSASGGKNGKHRQQMSLEQSLTVAQIKKYAVLQDYPNNNGLNGMHCSTPSTAVGSSTAITKIRSSLPSSIASTRRPSRSCTGEDGVDFVHLGRRDPRLAITTDHAVWLIDPELHKATLIAGDPVQYGYHDASCGFDARFSSPKGMTNIRSALFVADYWNDVVRCINLYTSQVDTVMDFRPQGPVAMCLSNSGVLYTLDSEGIHYANILCIMSSQLSSGAFGGTAFFQNLFADSSNRLRSCRTSMSEWTDVNSEVWDAVRRKSVSREEGGRAAEDRTFVKRRSSGMDITNAPTTLKRDSCGGDTMPETVQLSGDFQSRLEAHLQQAAEEQEVVKSFSNGKKKKTHNKKELRKKQELAANKPRTFKAVSPIPCQPSSEKMRKFSGWSISTPQIVHPGTADGETQETEADDAPSTAADSYLDEVKQVLSRIGSRRTSSVGGYGLGYGYADVPLTLSDLGQVKCSRNNSISHGSGMHNLAMSLRRATDHGGEHGGEHGPRFIQDLDSSKDRYLIFQESGQQEASQTPGAGTVMVLGGKAFYRDPKDTWSDKKLVNDGSQLNSRMSLTNLPESIFSSVRGEDEDGRLVSFVDLTFDGSRRPSVCESRRSSYRESSRRGSNREMMLEMDEGDSRRGSALLILPDSKRTSSVGPLINTSDRMGPDRRGSNFCADRRGSNLGVDRRGSNLGADRRGSNLGADRRGSNFGPDRRGSNFGPDRRGSNLASKMGPLLDLALNDQAGDVVPSGGSGPGSKRESIRGWQDYRRQSNAERRTSLGAELRRASYSGDTNSRRDSNAVSIVGEMAGSRRGSMLPDRRFSVQSRRGSVMLMPTVIDVEECERESASSSGGGEAEVTTKFLIDLPGTASELREEDEDCDEESKSSYRQKGETSRSKGSSHTVNTAGDLDSQCQACSSAADLAEKSDEDEMGEMWQDTPTSPVSNPVIPCQHSSPVRVASIGSGDESQPRSMVALQAAKQLFKTDGPTDHVSLNSKDSVQEGKGMLINRMLEDSHESLQEGKGMLITRMLEDLSPTGSTRSRSVENTPPGQTSPGGRPPIFVPLAQVPFTRDIDVESLPSQSMSDHGSLSHEYVQESSVAATGISALGQSSATYKVAEQTKARTWKRVLLPEPISQTSHTGKARKYPNTPLAITCYEHEGSGFLVVGLVFCPTLLKIIPPKHHEPDVSGRFNTLPVDSHRFLLADEGSHQIWLVNTTTKTRTHLAGCGKRGFLDGPLDTCRMHSPCSLTLDPHSHQVYVADKGNHVVRKLDLLSGLASTVVGSGMRGSCDGVDRRTQALDSPFEVSFAAPNHLVISCADNAVRCFDLKNGCLKTLLIGA